MSYFFAIIRYGLDLHYENSGKVPGSTGAFSSRPATPGVWNRRPSRISGIEIICIRG